MEIETILRANLFLRTPRANNYRIYIFASTSYSSGFIIVGTIFVQKPIPFASRDIDIRDIDIRDICDIGINRYLSNASVLGKWHVAVKRTFDSKKTV